MKRGRGDWAREGEYWVDMNDALVPLIVWYLDGYLDTILGYRWKPLPFHRVQWISLKYEMPLHWQLAPMVMGSFLLLKQLVSQLDRLANGKLPLKTIAVPSSMMKVSQKPSIIPSSQNSIIALVWQSPYFTRSSWGEWVGNRENRKGYYFFWTKRV